MPKQIAETEFREWVYKYSDPLFHYALRRIADEELCKDLVQDTFLSAWRNKDNFRGEASVKNWLFLILKRKVVDHFRKGYNKDVIESINEDHQDKTYFDADGHWKTGMYPKSLTVKFNETVESKDFHKVFSSCKRKLKDVQQAVFVMKYVDELDSDEICRTLGLTPSNFWIIMHRAKVQLRGCLEKNWINI